MHEFQEEVETALFSNRTVCAFVDCEVTYSGRAETFLPRGDRLLVIKSDNAVLLHKPDGSTPTNYMKAGSHISFEEIDDHLILHVHHPKEKAWLDIEIFVVLESMTRKLEDGQELLLEGNERDMSDWIRDNPTCISSSFHPVSREEQTDVGFIDVLGHNGEGTVVVVECKRVTASLSAVDQLRRYVERVKEIKGIETVEGIIAAPSITPNAQQMLVSFGFTFVAVDPPKRLERWKKDQKSLSEF